MNRNLLGTLLIVVFLIVLTHNQAEYIKSGNFVDNTCSIIYPATTTCLRNAGAAFAPASWFPSLSTTGSGTP